MFIALSSAAPSAAFVQPGSSPALPFMFGAGVAALVLVSVMRVVFGIVSGVAQFVEGLVSALVKGVIAAGGIGVVLLVAGVLYVVTMVSGNGSA